MPRKKPAIKAAPRETDKTHSARATFVALLGKGVSVSTAAEQAGISRATAYRWRDQMPAFARDWDEAKEQGLDKLEDRALQLAHAGSEKLIMFLLRAGRPEKYRENHRHTHEGSLDVNQDEVREAIAGKLARIAAGGAAAKVARKPE